MSNTEPATNTLERTLAPAPNEGALPLWAPLRRPIYRGFWLAHLVSNLGTWAHSAAAAWLMTTLTLSPDFVANVQTANSLPVWLLALPAGAIADTIDRRKLLMGAQAWMLLSAATLGVLTWAQRIDPWMVLILTACLSVGSVLTAPAWQATIPNLVPKEELPLAVTLGSINFNTARAVGPMFGSFLVKIASPAAAFLFNALSFCGVIGAAYLWRRPIPESSEPRASLLATIGEGLLVASRSVVVRAVIVRAIVFGTCSSAVWALLPLIARIQLKVETMGYGLLLSSIGTGAAVGGLLLSRLITRHSREAIATGAQMLIACIAIAIPFLPNIAFVSAALMVLGWAWLSLASTLDVALLTTIHPSHRGRSVSLLMLGFFFSWSVGSFVWGRVASYFDLKTALVCSGIGLFVGLLFTAKLPLSGDPMPEVAPETAP